MQLAVAGAPVDCAGSESRLCELTARYRPLLARRDASDRRTCGGDLDFGTFAHGVGPRTSFALSSRDNDVLGAGECARTSFSRFRVVAHVG
jgi:hypothetical protein